MPIDRNGWIASENLDIVPLVVAGESFVPGVLNDRNAFTVLQYVAVQMNFRVERIYAPGWHQSDDWGYAYRDNRNDPDSLSRHAFGLAFDYNATRHPNGVPASHTFTSAQINEIRKIVDECGGAVQWGGDFNGTPDAMHFQIDASKAVVAAAAQRIRNITEKDWFDMATKADLREVIDAAINNPAFIDKVATAVLKHPMEVKKADGSRTTKVVEQVLRETYNKHL